ncbi:MAG: hypothetical protein ITG07_02400 [Candidimonas sp.]|nr:hypothetical protein [Candidimonas sp.]
MAYGAVVVVQMLQREQDAYFAGVKAFGDGLALTDCPEYDWVEQHAAWRDGWVDASEGTCRGRAPEEPIPKMGSSKKALAMSILIAAAAMITLLAFV